MSKKQAQVAPEVEPTADVQPEVEPAADVQPEVEPAADLVAMTKDGEQIEVCSGQVAQHEALGWQVA